MSELTKISQLKPRPHLHADDLCGDTVVTIKGWIMAEAGVKKEVVGKLLLEEFDRPMIVNAGKRDALIKVFGDDLESLKGQKVTVFPATALYEGKTVPAIGLKIPKVKKEEAAAADV